MDKLNPETWSKRVLQSWTLRWTLLLLTVGLSANAVLAAIGGGFQAAGQLSSIVAALATVLLVSLTSQYAEQTERLVQENQNDRQFRKDERELDRQRELDSLRRALYEEIGEVAYFEALAEKYEIGTSAVGVATSSTIYESNAAKIGLLTDEEIDYVVEYYTRLDRVTELMEFQREMDTTVGKGPVETWFRATESLQRAVLRKLTLGYFGSAPSRNRKEMVKDQIDGLSRAQDAALEAIEENLNGV